MNEVDLGAFEPFKFLSTIGKNIVNFLTPGPEIFPKATTYVLPPEAALTISQIAPWTVSQVTAPPVSATPTITKIFAKVGPAPTNMFTTIWDTIKGPTQTFLDFFLTKGQYEAVASAAQSQADAQRAAQAVVEAQERVLAAQIQQQKETQGILSTEAWKKATPYAIPVAAGLAIVALLLIIGRGRESKKRK